jgi:hypothetical protein
MQASNFEREAHVAPDTPVPTPGVAVPVNASASPALA